MGRREQDHIGVLELGGGKDDTAPTNITKQAFNVDFVIGTESANVINVGIQLLDADGRDMAEATAVLAYISDAATGIGVAGTAPATSVAIGTDGDLQDITAKKMWILGSEADGDIDIDITETGADTWYLVIVMPNGALKVSGAITFA